MFRGDWELDWSIHYSFTLQPSRRLEDDFPVKDYFLIARSYWHEYSMI